MKWKFKKNAEPQGSSDGFWYDLTKGGYIDLHELLVDDDQIEQIENAVAMLCEFEQSLHEAELLNEF